MSDKDVTRLISDWAAGDQAAMDAVIPYIYDELHRIASGYMRREHGSNTLQPTALVNEAFMRLNGSQLSIENRSHFYVIAARQMRRILVDHARARNAGKRGGDAMHVTLDEARLGRDDSEPDVLELDSALSRLAEFDPRMAQGVELLFFGGLSYDEAAGILGLSKTALFEEIRLAKAWLKNQLQ